jgi:predicted  nucleic acid-binding Zn-ribbon protein
MNADLAKLVLLQRVESDQRANEAQLAEIPKAKQGLEKRVADERRALDSAREALAESQKSRRALEASLQDFETKRAKYKGQLMDVKTNKEYTAVLHEIEGVEREIRGVEDKILVDMESAESRAAAVRAEETTFKGHEDEGKAEAAKLDAQARALGERATVLAGERAAAAAAVPESLLELFTRISRHRGSGISEARDGGCSACRVKLRPQMFVDLKMHDDVIMQCPSCNRILYYVEAEAPAPVVAPAASGK